MKNKISFESLKMENFQKVSVKNSAKLIGGLNEPSGTAGGTVQTSQGQMTYDHDSGGTPNTYYGITYP